MAERKYFVTGWRKIGVKKFSQAALLQRHGTWKYTVPECAVGRVALALGSCDGRSRQCPRGVFKVELAGL